MACLQQHKEVKQLLQSSWGKQDGMQSIRASWGLRILLCIRWVRNGREKMGSYFFILYLLYSQDINYTGCGAYILCTELLYSLSSSQLHFNPICFSRTQACCDHRLLLQAEMFWTTHCYVQTPPSLKKTTPTSPTQKKPRITKQTTEVKWVPSVLSREKTKFLTNKVRQ